VEVVLGVLLVLAIAAFVAAPLRRRPAPEADARGEPAALADLEARKEAKYREIRDAQLDRAAGKLSEEDFERLDAELRRDAVEILRALDEVRAREGAEGR
jgi:hypothetical protein